MIHNPESILFSWAQDEEEGQHLMGTYEYSHLLLEEFRKAYVNKKTSTVDMPHYVQFFGSLKMSLFDGVEEPLMIWNENGTKRTNFTLDGTKKHTPIVWTENTDVLIYDIGNNVQFKVYKKDKERLEKYLYPASEEERIAQIQTAIDKIDKDISNSNMIAILAAIPTGEYRLITLEQRKIALEKITSEMMNESGPNKINEEVIAINLLKYNNSDQDLFNILFENPQLVFNLMKRMHDEVGNDNYTALIRELTLLYYKQSLDLVNRLALETNTYLIWSRKYLPPYFNTAYEVVLKAIKYPLLVKSQYFQEI